MYLAGILLQMAAAPGIEAKAQEHSIFSIILSSDPVVKAVLFILVAFSIASWAVIFFKFFQLKRAQRNAEKFAQVFDSNYSLEELLTKSVPQDGNPLYTLFSSGIADIMRFKQLKAKDPTYKGHLSIEHIDQNIRRAQNNEMHRLEQLTPFLATVASATPFIGLFGTVWGILAAFWKIGQQGSAGLAVVGPYIAEALIATAVGLAAAIPAVIAYNYFVTRLKYLGKEIGNFAGDLSQRISREYF